MAQIEFRHIARKINSALQRQERLNTLCAAQWSTSWRKHLEAFSLPPLRAAWSLHLKRKYAYLIRPSLALMHDCLFVFTFPPSALWKDAICHLDPNAWTIIVHYFATEVTCKHLIDYFLRDMRTEKGHSGSHRYKLHGVAWLGNAFNWTPVMVIEKRSQYECSVIIMVTAQ